MRSLLSSRFLVGLLWEHLFRAALSAYAAEDVQLLRQQSLLRNATSQQLEVAHLVPSNEEGLPITTPLSAALDQIGGLSYAGVAADYAVAIREAVKIMDSYCAHLGNLEVGADTLMPLMVLLVVYADLPHGYTMLQV